jgi:hypothetical protein
MSFSEKDMELELQIEERVCVEKPIGWPNSLENGNGGAIGVSL